MDKDKKKTLLIIGAVEAVILVFCLTVSIIVLVTLSKATSHDYVGQNGIFIGTLQNNPALFFCTIVLPLFLIFIADGIYLIYYSAKKQSALSDKEHEAIVEEAKRQAREEVAKEMAKQTAAGTVSVEKPAEKVEEKPEEKK